MHILTRTAHNRNWDTASPALKLECLQFREADREVDTGRLTVGKLVKEKKFTLSKSFAQVDKRRKMAKGSCEKDILLLKYSAIGGAEMIQRENKGETLLSTS